MCSDHGSTRVFLISRIELVAFYMGLGAGVALGVSALIIHKYLLFFVAVLIVTPAIVAMSRSLRKSTVDQIDRDNPPDDWYK